jgi:hypothetical protein
LTKATGAGLRDRARLDEFAQRALSSLERSVTIPSHMHWSSPASVDTG